MVLIMINSYKPSSLLTYSLYHRYATIGQWNIIRCGIASIVEKTIISFVESWKYNNKWSSEV